MEEGHRVQAIASVSLSKETIPLEFIRAENEQPGFTTFKGDVHPQIPIIDFSSTDLDEKKLAESIVDASCKWGIFQIVNHGIPLDVIKRLQKVGIEFFELPQEEKEVYAKPCGSTSIEGYGTRLQKDMGGKKGWVDHLFNKVLPPSAVDHRFWPKNPPEYREATEEYAYHLQQVANKLFESLSIGLGLEKEEIKRAFGGDELVYNLKINYYPPCPCPDLALGVPPHTDMSAFTILVSNNVQGLQVFQDDQWINVNNIPNSLIIHVGDQIEILTNGKCKSVFHRSIVNKEQTRMSWPVFLEPPPDFEVGPYHKFLSEDNCSKYKTKKFGDYCYCKLNKIPQ
ncbi:hypothetical protein M9H77_18590 [Catharanthus roseus]|uniref:Uncharacterized protein n=1 Tax=Catharanthus roseus TaxID=4058 RepID=A0ACC0B811_CATRO|nr:hypothetical protein M9H77_18590 [Catharanthus roseus]